MYSELNETQIRQYIDAEQSRKVALLAESRSAHYRGSMYWRTVKGHDYLIREYDKRLQKSLGVRTPETESTLAEFKEGKAAAAESTALSKELMERHRRMNVALRVGRTPNVVIELLETLRNEGLQDHFLVIGTNALFAYETLAGIRFDGGITATTDVDFLWDVRKKIEIVLDSTIREEGFIGLLKKVDPSFEVLEDEKYRAINSKGYLVDLIKRRSTTLMDDTDPQQIFPNPDDLWAVKVKGMDWLLSSPKFRQMVVGIDGRMAEMVTVDPRAFVLFKLWLSQKDDRDPMKKPRDLAQAKAVYALIQERLPQFEFERLHVFPEKIRDILSLK